jgi:hypothetical protein
MTTAEALRELTQWLGGRRVSGGCEYCAAYQTLHEDADLPGIFHIRIHRDDWCSFLARIQRS